jgi:hypothetical protein
MRSKNNNRKYKMSYYDYDYDYESARDKYYESMETWCECYDSEEEPCDYCSERSEKIAAAEAAAKKAAEKAAEKERAKGWPTTRTEIKRRMTAIDAESDIWMRIWAFDELFKYLLNHCGDFMAATPRFRDAVVKKIDDIRTDKRVDCLYGIMESLRDYFLYTLPTRADFVAPK